MPLKIRSLIVSVLLVSFSGTAIIPARADALDGDWCNTQDGKLSIDGEIIMTPGGQRVIGEYGRHRFTYTAPQGGWNAGQQIVIQQLHDELMELSVGEGEAKQWTPCKIVS